MNDEINEKKKMSKVEIEDYLHFLASSGNHNIVGAILGDETRNNNDKLIGITQWYNQCVDQTNYLNEKHGFMFYDDDFLEKEVKIYTSNGNFHFGLRV